MDNLELCRHIDEVMLNEEFNLNISSVGNQATLKIEMVGKQIEILKVGFLYSVEVDNKQYESNRLAIIAALSPYLGKRLIIGLFG